MSSPFISVIMPTYNQAEFIGEAIESVLNQTYQSLELIVVDNYSQDKTQGIVEAFNDQRIKYYKFSNQGIIAASRNYGIRQANGKYIAFIDSDDIWFADKLRLQIDMMENDESCQMVFCQFQAADANGRTLGKIFGPKDIKVGGYIYDKLIRYNFVVSSSVVVRRMFLNESGGFDEAANLRCVEDFDLWLRIARRHKALFLPKVLGMSRIHSCNTNVGSQRLQKALNVIDKQLADGFVSKPRADRAKANFYFREGWFSINRDTQLARSCFWKACELNAYNPKIIFLSLLGAGISFFPSLYNRIRKNELDKKIAWSFFNSQNL